MLQLMELAARTLATGKTSDVSVAEVKDVPVNGPAPVVMPGVAGLATGRNHSGAGALALHGPLVQCQQGEIIRGATGAKGERASGQKHGNDCDTHTPSSR